MWNIIVDGMAICAFAYTLVSGIKSLFVNRVNLEINISDVRYQGDGMLIYAGVVNKSRLPVCITNIFVKTSNELYECAAVPTKVLEVKSKTNNVEMDRRTYLSTPMPVPISELSGIHGFFWFPDCQQEPLSPSTVLTFQVNTNRGKPVELQSPLSDSACQAKRFG